MAKGLLKKILKGIMIGGGTVLSFIPAIGPIVGGTMMAAGIAIKTSNGNSGIDQVSNAAGTLNAALGIASGASQGASAAISTNNIMAWISRNMLIVIAFIVGLFLIFRRKKR
jgi:hypothetical protein